jgi:beta-lactamase regulating signal transducer with metallopeptidase domain
MKNISLNIGQVERFYIERDISSVDKVINSSSHAAVQTADVDVMQVIIFVLSVIWIVGVVILIVYSIFSYMRLKNKVSTAIRLHDNIYECPDIETPFVLGILYHQLIIDKRNIYICITSIKHSVL